MKKYWTRLTTPTGGQRLSFYDKVRATIDQSVDVPANWRVATQSHPDNLLLPTDEVVFAGIYCA
jgi:predicted oxidoreductase (fatty acid repression mutant protein)